MELVFATNNEHKIREIQQILGASFHIVDLKQIGHYTEIPETGNTIEANSMEKAMFIYKKYNRDCFADDTGLEIEALNNRPGVFSARYAGDARNMDDNINKVLFELKDQANRNARFKTVISLIISGDKLQFEGIINGKIIHAKAGKGGFGYDPVFVPNGYEQSFAQMDPLLKNKISHRGIALQKLTDYLTSCQK